MYIVRSAHRLGTYHWLVGCGAGWAICYQPNFLTISCNSKKGTWRTNLGVKHQSPGSYLSLPVGNSFLISGLREAPDVIQRDPGWLGACVAVNINRSCAVARQPDTEPRKFQRRQPG